MCYLWRAVVLGSCNAGDDSLDENCDVELDFNRALCRQLASQTRKRSSYAETGEVYAAC